MLIVMVTWNVPLVVRQENGCVDAGALRASQSRSAAA